MGSLNQGISTNGKTIITCIYESTVITNTTLPGEDSP